MRHYIKELVYDAFMADILRQTSDEVESVEVCHSKGEWKVLASDVEEMESADEEDHPSAVVVKEELEVRRCKLVGWLKAPRFNARNHSMKTPVSSDGFNWELAPLHRGEHLGRRGGGRGESWRRRRRRGRSRCDLPRPLR